MVTSRRDSAFYLATLSGLYLIYLLCSNWEGLEWDAIVILLSASLGGSYWYFLESQNSDSPAFPELESDTPYEPGTRFIATRQDATWMLFAGPDAIAHFNEVFFGDEGPVEFQARRLHFALFSPRWLEFTLKSLDSEGERISITATKYWFINLTSHFGWTFEHKIRTYDLRGGSWICPGGDFKVFSSGEQIGRILSTDQLEGGYRFEFNEPLPNEVALMLLLLCVTRSHQRRRRIFSQ